MRYTLTVMMFAALLPSAAAAQTNATKPPVDHSQVISTNPFGWVFKWYNGEYERKVSTATTVGVSGSYLEDGEIANGAVFARWYPQGAALDGFYLGARLGAFGHKIYDYEYPAPAPRSTNPSTPIPPSYPIRHERQVVAPGAGVEIGYNWLLGAKQNLSVGVGFGLTRTFGDNANEYIPVVPGIRLVNIGIAF